MPEPCNEGAARAVVHPRRGTAEQTGRTRGSSNGSQLLIKERETLLESKQDILGQMTSQYSAKK